MLQVIQGCRTGELYEAQLDRVCVEVFKGMLRHCPGNTKTIPWTVMQDTDHLVLPQIKDIVISTNCLNTSKKPSFPLCLPNAADGRQTRFQALRRCHFMDPLEVPQEPRGPDRIKTPVIIAEAQFSAFILHEVPQCLPGRSGDQWIPRPMNPY